MKAKEDEREEEDEEREEENEDEEREEALNGRRQHRTVLNGPTEEDSVETVGQPQDYQTNKERKTGHHQDGSPTSQV